VSTNEASIAARVKVAATNTWENRVQKFWEILNEYLPNGNSKN